jgi:molybdate transport system substrate-binding protein
MRRLVFVVIGVALLVVSCGTDSSDRLDVFGAASLTAAFNDMHADATFNFAGSQVLATQIEAGAPADVFASADRRNMQTLVDAGLVEAPRVFARNKLVIAVAPGNPENVRSLGDLERDGITLVLADPAVPAGNYARQAFAKAGLPEPRPASNELDVKAALAKLTSGEADAVVVYATDVQALAGQVEAVAILDDQNVIAEYPIAVVKASTHKHAAEVFVNEVLGSNGQRVLENRGFLPPS